MKPSDAKKLLPGTVVSVGGYGEPRRLVVQSVRVSTPRKVFVYAKGRYDAREYDASVLSIPTAEAEALWARQDAEEEKRAARLAEKTMVCNVLGGTVIDKEAGYGSVITYFVQLTREQALDIVRRLEST
jgi:hypothetical protein